MKTSKYQALLDSIPASLRSLAEEAYCIGYQTRLACERAIEDAGRNYPDEVYDQNDDAILQEALYGDCETGKQVAMLACKYAPEIVESSHKYRPVAFELVAKRLRREHEKADTAFLTHLKYIRERRR